MMDIPINATVECTDGGGGRSTHVIMNPDTREVTHLVVETSGPTKNARVVPIGLVVASTPDRIHLSCTGDELARMDPFVETQYVAGREPYGVYSASDYLTWPSTSTEAPSDTAQKRIPHGEVAVGRGMRVVASDREIGAVGDVLMDQDSTEVTHIVLTVGGFLNKRDVAIPLSEIDRIEDDTIYVALDKHAIEALPTRRRNDDV
jgi:sporulation protein YlmC with PRC-barrel domain